MAATLPPEATQAHVYDVIAAPLVARWLGGVDLDLISYGQTGSGKTFTMFGPPHSMAHAFLNVFIQNMYEFVKNKGGYKILEKYACGQESRWEKWGCAAAIWLRQLPPSAKQTFPGLEPPNARR